MTCGLSAGSRIEVLIINKPVCHGTLSLSCSPVASGGPTGAGPPLLKCCPSALIPYIGMHHIKKYGAM